MPALAKPVGGPTAAVGVVVVLLAVLVGGAGAGWSALAGAAIAPVFLGLTLLAVRLGRRAGPEATMVLVLLTYLTKFVATAVLLLVLQRQPWVDPPWVAAAVLACAVTWVVGHVVATWNHRGLIEAPA